MVNKRIIISILALMLASLACQFGASSVEETETPDIGPQLTMTSQSIELDQFRAQATADALAVRDEQTPEETVEPDIEEGGEVESEEMVEPVAEEQEFVADMTEMDEIMNADLQFLIDQGVISGIKEEYIPFEDISREFAQINYFSWWNTDYAPTNFVIRSDVNWQSASDSANWPFSGCGWVFGEKDSDNFHMAFLSLDGYGFLKKWVDGKEEVVVKQRYGNVDIPQGSAKLLLSVQNDRAAFYVNGEEMYNIYDGNIDPGKLSFTVLSGTNSGFGTRCEWSNTGLMIFD